MNDIKERKLIKSGAGYVLIRPDQLDCKEPKNIHVLPAFVEVYSDGTRGWRITDRETCCGEPTNNGTLSCIPEEEFLKTESRALRSELARLQNVGTRICGSCAAHFYADYLDEED